MPRTSGAVGAARGLYRGTLAKAPLFQKYDTVLLKSNRALVGRITSEPVLDAGEYW